MIQKFTEALPADPITENYIRKVSNACYSFVKTFQPQNPKLIHYNKELADQLQLLFSEKQAQEVFSGQKDFPDQRSFAMCYGGHQFGHWAGQLGDGRAINIAEIETPVGTKTVQLKGAGPTPYSRSADGLAVLRSSIREYLCSEAMHHLGISTTRALSLSLSGEKVMRDVMYNGNPELEPGAIVCRVSNSFVRFGSFEILSARKEKGNLEKLMNYVLENHYAHIGIPCKESYLKMFKEIATRTLDMIINWERVGFVHGVMNTDNMSILGETIDYGPYGWLEDFDPSWTPNTTDAQNRRYRFGNQASIALWNLNKLANAIYPLINETKDLERILDEYKVEYFQKREKMYMQKLGLTQESEELSAVIEAFLLMLEKSSVDMTMFWRKLSDFKEAKDFLATVESCSYLPQNEFKDHCEEWLKCLATYSSLINKEKRSDGERKLAMDAINPKYVLRNYIAQQIIEKAEKGDFSMLDEVYELLQNPYADQPEYEKYFAKRPEWAKNKIGCSMLSCSS